ncbi:hypothetical protein Vretimale_15850 [Volvox reticuliferus]|uniref:Uncharacterized protein n=1 Tax=Volvox reticuliferus TaxID=1737510 RepID=A0A8J4GRP1_9CHLO|nr:hypothetical protein Vretimale_15850 [Volvox reticuliferus]
MTVVCEVCGYDGALDWFLQCKNHERCHQGRHLYCIDGLRIRRRPASLGVFGNLECSWCLQTAESTSRVNRQATFVLDKSSFTTDEGQGALKEGTDATAREAKAPTGKPSVNKLPIGKGVGSDKVPAGKAPACKPTAGKAAASADRRGKALNGSSAAGGREEVNGDKKPSAACISSQRAVAGGGSAVPSAAATAPVATATVSLPESMAGAQCGRSISKPTLPGAIAGRTSGVQQQSRVKPSAVVASGAATVLVADKHDRFDDLTLPVKQNKVAGPSSARSQLAGAGRHAVVATAGNSGPSKPGSVFSHGPITKQNVGNGPPGGAPIAGNAGTSTGAPSQIGQTGGCAERGASLAGPGTASGSHTTGGGSFAARSRPTAVAPTGRVSFHYQLSSGASQTKLDNRGSLSSGSNRLDSLGSLPMCDSTTRIVATSRHRRVKLWTCDMLLEGCIPRTEVDPKRLRMSIESVSPHESMVRLSKLLQMKTPPDGIRCNIMPIEEVPRAISEAHSFYLSYDPCETCLVMFPARNIGNTSKFFKESLITMLSPPEGNEQGVGERAQLEEPGKILAMDLSFLTADDLARDPVLERLLHSELDAKGDSKPQYQLYFMPETVPVDGVTPENGVMPCLLCLTGSRKHVHLMVPPYNRRLPTEEDSILINPSQTRGPKKKVTFELRDNHKHETGRLLKETVKEGKALKKVLLEEAPKEGEPTAADTMECDTAEGSLQGGSACTSDPGSMEDGPSALDPNVEALCNVVLMASSSQPAGGPVMAMQDNKGLIGDSPETSDPVTQQAVGMGMALATPSQPVQLVRDAKVTISAADDTHNSLVGCHDASDSDMDIDDTTRMAPSLPAGSLDMCLSASLDGAYSTRGCSMLMSGENNQQQDPGGSATQAAAACGTVMEMGMKMNDDGKKQMPVHMVPYDECSMQFVWSIEAIGKVAEQQAHTSSLGNEGLRMLLQHQQRLVACDVRPASLSDNDMGNSGDNGGAAVGLHISDSTITAGVNNGHQAQASQPEPSGVLSMTASIHTVEGSLEPLDGRASNREPVDAARCSGMATDYQLSDWRGLADCWNPPNGLHRHVVLPLPDKAGSVEMQQLKVGKKRPGSPLHSVAHQAGLNMTTCTQPAQWSWGRPSAPVLQAFLMESGCMDLPNQERLPDLIPQLQVIPLTQLHGCQIRLVACGREAPMLGDALDGAAQVLGFQWSPWCKAVDREKLSSIQVICAWPVRVGVVCHLH